MSSAVINCAGEEADGVLDAVNVAHNSRNERQARYWQNKQAREQLAVQEQQQAAEERRRNQKRNSYNLRKNTLRSSGPNVICRHCGTDGHDCQSERSCPLFCRHCLVTGHTWKDCPVRRLDEENNAKSNADAAAYKAAVDSTMMFYSCGICDREYGLSLMKPLAEVEGLIQKSGISARFAQIVAEAQADIHDLAAVAYGNALAAELQDGIRRNATHACNDCIAQVSSKKGAGCIPKLALVNGYFRGRTPEVLKKLTTIELSLISIINVCTKLVMLPHNSHATSTATVFLVMNEVVDVAVTLPHVVSLGAQVALIKMEGSKSPLPLRYNPRHVLDALHWLTQNNPLYREMLLLPTGADGSVDQCWRDGGADISLDVPHISAEAADYEGIEERSLEHPTDLDGHAVNPGAPPSSTTDVFLYKPHSADTRQQMVQISQGDGPPTVLLVRRRGEYTADYKTDLFMQKAFPEVYPYGRGGPGQHGVTYNWEYVCQMLHLGGDREFQQCSRFIFYSYTWIMRRQVGIISYLAARSEATDSDDFTAADARELLHELSSGKDGAECTTVGLSRAKIRALMKKMQPFVQSVPGTEMYFEKERKKLMAMISSTATTTTGQWTWFLTEAQPDMFMSEIYDNAVSSARDTPAHIATGSLLDRQNYADNLTASSRSAMLKSHPFLSARIHSLQQQAYWSCVLQGQRKPLGNIVDYWMRVEFQMRGTPHLHSLINVSTSSLPGINASSVTSTCQEDRQRVQQLVASVATASLLVRDKTDTSELRGAAAAQAAVADRETEWEFNIDRPFYFLDSEQPARTRFTTQFNYAMNTATGAFADVTARRLYRRLQLANQMHRCRLSCWKYCKRGVRKCRYGFPQEPVTANSTQAVIVEDKDRRGRNRIRVLPPRNNAYINNHIRDPLCFIASKGNQDIQYIQNTTGGAEYCSKYCSKSETADSQALQNAVNRKLAQAAINLPEDDTLPLRCHFEAVGNAIIGAQQIGSVHACYILGKLPVVLSSRETVFVNCLKRSELNLKTIILSPEELSAMVDEESALVSSPTTQLGRRDAYHALYRQQTTAYGSMRINYFAFVSSYATRKATPRTPNSRIKEDAPHLFLDSYGFIANSCSFVLGNVMFSARPKPAVLCLSPKIPIDETKEASAFAILLLYSDWGELGEPSLIAPEETAVQKLATIKSSLPEHVLVSLAKTAHSEMLLGNTGTPEATCDAERDADAEAEAALLDEQLEYVNDNAGEAIDAIPQSMRSPPLLSERVTVNATIHQAAYLHHFIEDMKKGYFADRDRSNVLSAEERTQKELDSTYIAPIPCADEKEMELQLAVAQLNAEQRRAYDDAIYHISGLSGKQMIMFLSGEGGTGKSRVINTIRLYTQLLFGKTEGTWGAVLVTAPTGGAAHNVGGSTWHSALNKQTSGSRQHPTAMSSTAVVNLQRKAAGTKLFVMDEISLLSCEELYEISTRLGVATGQRTGLFGGLHTLLVGDLYQMKPVSGTAIVTTTIPASNQNATQGRKIFAESLTNFCMLLQNVRAQSASGTLSPLAAFNTKARVGDLSNALLLTMNDRVRNTMSQAAAEASSKALWITSTHNKIAEINAFFENKRLANNERMFPIIARHAPNKTGVPVPTGEVRQRLYAEKGDRKGQRSTLMLSHIRLFIGSRVRLTRNLFVEGGLYNGAMGTVWGFVYRGSGDVQLEIDGSRRLFGDMDDADREIPIVLVQMDGDESTFPYSCSTHVPRLVPISEVQSAGLVRGEYHRFQVPLLPAEARTAHSVQGYTAHDGVVVDPGSKFFAGDYTAISRATSKERVILLAPLQEESFAGLTHSSYRTAVHKEYNRLAQLIL